MSYFDGFYLDSFQTTKRHFHDSYSIYIAIFSSFLLGVYPVGVTDLQPYFTQTISHNSMNVHWIPNKLGTEICLNDSVKYTKFQLDRSMHLRFMAAFVKCAKRSRNRRKNPKFGRSYLRNGWSDFLQNWNVDSPPSRHFCSKFSYNQIRDHGATKV